MATRSTIAIKQDDGRYRVIYSHWDGYPSHNGLILCLHYDTPEKVNALLDMGNVSVLGEVIGEKHSFEDRGENNQCTFYGRDRGEPDQEARTLDTLDDLIEWSDGSGAEYVYVFTGEHWYFTPIPYDTPVYPALIPLVSELKAELAQEEMNHAD